MRIIQKVAQVLQCKICVAKRLISQSFLYFVSEEGSNEERID